MLRLQSRFSITIVSLVIGIIALLAGALLFQFSSLSNELIDTGSRKMAASLSEQMEKRGEAMVRLLGDNLVNPLYAYDMAKIHDLLYSVKKQKDVLFAFVYDTEGKIIQDGTSDVFDFGKTMEDTKSCLAVKSKGRLLSRIQKNTIEVSIPIWIGETPLGGVKIGLSLEGIDADISEVLIDLDEIGGAGLRRYYVTVGLTTLVLVTLGIIVALSVANRLIRPIREVSAYAEKVGRGDYGELISPKRTDEIGDLINAFNHMSHNLDKTTVSKDYVERIISNMNDPLIVLGLNGDMRLVNQATAELLGYKKEQLLNQPFEVLFSYEFRPGIKKLLADLAQYGFFPHVDQMFATKNGNPIPISLSGAAIQNDKQTMDGFVLVAQDITNRIKAEAELKTARDAAESANTAKSEFLANMSHELRTPLNHIIGFTELVVNRHFGDLNDLQEEYLTDSLKSSKHLLALINDILDLSKVEAGKMTLETSNVKIKQLVENSLIMIREKAMKHGIRLTSNLGELPEVITADERKLKQVIYNLLSNAAKFTPDGGSIYLSARQAVAEKEHLITSSGEKIALPLNWDKKNIPPRFIVFSVKDTGIGIKDENIERIFLPFEQVENSSNRKFHGTGLGLSLTKKMVELHGGRIWVESKGENRGATFSIIIPA